MRGANHVHIVILSKSSLYILDILPYLRICVLSYCTHKLGFKLFWDKDKELFKIMNEKGLVMVYTGNGKGKTTAALGLALRAIGNGARVMMMQFMKGKTYGELKAAEHLPGFEIIMTGRSVFVDKKNPAEIDVKIAQEAFQKVRDSIDSGQYDLVILDEINVALDYTLISVSQVLNLINNRPAHVNLVLTGRNAPTAIMEASDMISEVKEIKHHYQKGIKARQGIEY